MGAMVIYLHGSAYRGDLPIALSVLFLDRGSVFRDDTVES